MSFRPFSFIKPIAVCTFTVLASNSLLADTSLEEINFSSKMLEEIIVTADFYESSPLKIASSVSVIDESTIQQHNAEHLEQILGFAPNVNYATGASRGRFIQIRGIGERSEFIEPVNYSVGVLIDGIDFTGISTAASTLDVQQIEVLRGPQGTLYGANALAGLINIVSVAPSEETQGKLEASIGNYNSRTINGAIGGSLSDSVGYRIAAQSTQSDGFITNTFLNRDDTQDIYEKTLRGKLSVAASENLDLGLTLFYANIDNGYDAFSFESDRTTRSDEPGYDRQKTAAFALTADWRPSEDLNIEATLSTADSDIEYAYDEDWSNPVLCTLTTCLFGDYSSFDSYFRDNKNTSIDLRLKSEDQAASWVIGFYYRDQNVDLNRIYSFDPPFNSSYDTTNTAIYGDWSKALSEKLTFSAGARIELRDADYSDDLAFGFSTDETLWGGKLSLSYQIDDAQFVYATLSRGYKPGGANSNASVPAQFREYDTETALNYELGLKGLFLDNRLSAQIAVFYQDRNDIQTDSAIVTLGSGGNPARFDDFLTNAANGKNYGMEAQLSYSFSEATEIYTSLGLLSTSYGDYINFQHVNRNAITGEGVNLDGRDQPYAPNYQFVAGINSAVTDVLTINLNLEGKDRFFLSNDHEIQSDSYVLVNANLTYSANSWSASLWGKNLTDKKYQNRGFGSFPNDPRDAFSSFGPYFQLSDPRTFGITGRYSF